MKKLLNLTDKHVGSRVRMRWLRLDLSQSGLPTALGVTFQQVQKYEMSGDRISASRLDHISDVLQVPIPFFFEGLPRYSGASERTTDAPFKSYVSDFLATSGGISLSKAFTQIKDPKLRRRIVRLVEEVAG